MSARIGRLELGRREIAEGGVNPLGQVDVVEEAADPRVRLGEILVAVQGDLFLLERPHEPLGC